MNTGKKIAALACAVLLSTGSVFAQSSFGIGLGLSTPNEAISSVYNNISTGTLDEDLRDAAALGYHFQLKYRFGLGESVRFAASAGLHRFPEADVVIVDPRDNKTYNFVATSNIVPITAGLEYSLVKSALGVYLTGDLSYNYFSNSLDLKTGDGSIPLGINEDASYSRVGVALGAGVDFDLKVVVLDLTGKYHLANLINKETDEPDRSYFALTLSACFGSR